MKKLLCILLTMMLLTPLVAFGEGETASRYHALYENMKVENSEFSWRQLMDEDSEEEIFYDFPDLQLRLYAPQSNLEIVDEHDAANSFRSFYQRAGLTLAEEGIRIRYLDEDEHFDFSVARVMNPEFEGCDVPIDASRVSKSLYVYVENTFRINGFTCACTWSVFDFDTGFASSPQFILHALLRISDDCVLIIRGSKLFPGKSYEEDGQEISIACEKYLSYLLCFAAMDTKD